MKTIHALSTLELERMEREYNPPKSLQESLIIYGIQAELKSRMDTNFGMNPNPNRDEIDDLNEDINEHLKKIEELEENNDKLHTKIVSLEDKHEEEIDELKLKNSWLEEEIAELKSGLTAK